MGNMIKYVTPIYIWECGNLKDFELVPQVLFSGVICKGNNGTLDGTLTDFLFPTFTEQLNTLVKVIKMLKEKRGTIIAWFLIDKQFHLKEIISLEKQIERYIERSLGHNWEVEAQFIPTDIGTLNYDQIKDEIERNVHRLCVRYPLEYFAQITNFGDPVVYQALFVEGIRQFEERYASIYWNEHEVHVELTKLQSFTETWVKQFRDFIIDHDYQAAYEMLKDIDNTDEAIALRLLIQMMIDRLNFAFGDALKHLDEAIRILGRWETRQIELL